MGSAYSKNIKEENDGSNNQEDKNVIVLGAGNFGTSLADHLASEGNNVTIYARDQLVVDGINNNQKNIKYLSDVKLSDNLKATNKLDDDLFTKNTVILCAIPTKQMRMVLKSVKQYIKPNHLLIFVNKGIESSTLALPSDVVDEELGPKIGYNATFLSGPSFAVEVVKRKITCVSVASKSNARALRTQRLFHAPHFRVYDTDDVVGVEVAGALKNVMALAAGGLTGMNMEMNARTALVTRALAEITRIGVKMGANPLTFSGLSGVGDLFLTCTSEKSRNFTVGFRLARGESLDHIVKTLGSVAEGVATAPSAYALCRKYDVDSPIIDAVYGVLCQGVDPTKAVEGVINRDPRPEIT